MWTANGDWLTSGPIWLRDGHSFSPLSVKQWPRQSFSTFQVNLLLNSFRAFKYNAVQQGKDCGEWRLRTVKRSFVRVKHRPTSSTVSRNYIYIFFLFKATTMFRSPSTVARYLFTVEIAAMGKLLSRAVLLWFHIDREGSAEMVFFPSPISIAAGHPANRSVGIGKSFRCNVVVWDFLFERVGRAAERGRWRWRRDGSFAFLLQHRASSLISKSLQQK